MRRFETKVDLDVFKGLDALHEKIWSALLAAQADGEKLRQIAAAAQEVLAGEDSARMEEKTGEITREAVGWVEASAGRMGFMELMTQLRRYERMAQNAAFEKRAMAEELQAVILLIEGYCKRHNL